MTRALQVIEGEDSELSRRGDGARHLAAIMRAELASLTEEIVLEIRRAVPEYARPLDGPYGTVLRQGVEHAVRLFVDLVENPDTPRVVADEICRKLGRAEVHEGRTMDDLQAAYRVGARVAWGRIMRVGRRHAFSSAVVSSLADRLFVFIDELVTLSFEGYREARARVQGAGEELRRRLLRLILERPAVPLAAVTDLAHAIGWKVPEHCAMVAVETGAEQAESGLLGSEVLADLRVQRPYLLLPGPITPMRQRQLTAAFRGTRVAIGPVVPLVDAASSLRLARRALRLVADGILPEDPVTVCAEHLSTLWLLGDPGLIGQIGKRRLAPLAQLPAKQRARLASTLLAWIQTQGSTQEIAERLQVHPQTVRYRMRQLDAAFGDQLRDPQARFEMELALRVADLRRPRTG